PCQSRVRFAQPRDGRPGGLLRGGGCGAGARTGKRPRAPAGHDGRSRRLVRAPGARVARHRLRRSREARAFSRAHAAALCTCAARASRGEAAARVAGIARGEGCCRYSAGRGEAEVAGETGSAQASNAIAKTSTAEQAKAVLIPEVSITVP